ncbi:unnamed protein product [Ceutorhynchus assimilis]|uniref:Reverse transcriptase n=1 Tax=Ceutorhynchus assimilis TaxID=467358 RepID=A0A9N9MYE3_9CUCU|nr:unnamed protein product [Ceutorhynchus assimilis]
MDKTTKLRVGQQNLHHDHNATIRCVTEAIDNGIDLLLLQDPYTHKVGGEYILPVSSSGYSLVADQAEPFQACVVVISKKIETLKLTQFNNNGNGDKEPQEQQLPEQLLARKLQVEVPEVEVDSLPGPSKPPSTSCMSQKQFHSHEEPQGQLHVEKLQVSEVDSLPGPSKAPNTLCISSSKSYSHDVSPVGSNVAVSDHKIISTCGRNDDNVSITQGVIKKGHARVQNKLNSIRGLVAKTMIGAFVTTSTEAVSVLANIPPIDLIIMETLDVKKYKAGLNIDQEDFVFEAQPRLGKKRLKEKLEERTLLRWQRIWDESDKGRVTKRMFPTVIERQTCHIKFNKKVTQMLTGHGQLMVHYKRIGQSMVNTCNFCDMNEAEDQLHRLYSCPEHTEARRRILDLMDVGYNNWLLMENNMAPVFQGNLDNVEPALLLKYLIAEDALDLLGNMVTAELRVAPR